MSTSALHTGNSRFKELDGLRALAVVTVILFHCDVGGLFNAGFLGVDMFFAISGLIITGQLVKEFRRDGNFEIRAFYFRRLVRLLPPVAVVVISTLLITPLVSHEAFARLIADVPAALFHVANWWQILEKQDYMDTTPHVLKHLWSLAVEEQFYFVWPLVAYAVLKKLGVRMAGLLALVLALASTYRMWSLYELNIDQPDQNRMYLGSDTHAMGLMIGAALACFWNPWQNRERGRVMRAVWQLVAVGSLAGLLYMSLALNFSEPWLYRGGFLLAPVLTCAVAYCTMNDTDSLMSKVLRHGVVQWLGSRSYSLYLLHWPILVWVGLFKFDAVPKWVVLVSALLAVGVLSELLYRQVEQRSKNYDKSNPTPAQKLFGLLNYVLFAAGLAWLAPKLHADRPATVPEVAAPVSPGVPAAVPASVPVPVAAAASASASASSAAAVPDYTPPARVRTSGGDDMFALGDSVLLGAQGYLVKAIPGIQVDAVKGRQASQGIKVVQEWHAKLKPSSTVLVHLGTNGYINEKQYKTLLGELAGVKSVILINVHADRRWTEPNNEMIERMSHEFPNAHLLDWSRVSEGHPDFFVHDGIHLTFKGILALTSEIQHASGGEVLPEVKADVETAEAKAQAKAARKAAAKAKAEAKAAAKAEAKAAKAGARAGAKEGSKEGAKEAAKDTTKPDAKTDAKADAPSAAHASAPASAAPAPADAAGGKAADTHAGDAKTETQ